MKPWLVRVDLDESNPVSFYLLRPEMLRERSLDEVYRKSWYVISPKRLYVCELKVVGNMRR